MKPSLARCHFCFLPINLRLILLLAVFLGAVLPVCAQENFLVAGTVLERSISGGKTNLFNVTLDKGDFVHVLVEQKGVDVEVALISPTGEQIARMDSPNSEWGPEPLACIAAIAGEYKVRVTSSGPPGSTGKIAISMVARRPASTNDSEQVAAERAIEKAYDIGVQQTPEALENSVSKLQEALRYYDGSPDRYRRGIVLLSIGLARAQENQFRDAINYYKRSASIFESLADKHMQATSINNIAGCLDFLGDYPEALKLYAQALSLLQGSEERYTQAAILNNVGKIHTDTGDWEQAAHFYDQALALARAAGDKPLLANTLHNSGNNNLELGQPETALPYFQEELSVARAIGDKLRQSRALDSMGWAYSAQGDAVKAMDSYQQALIFQTQKSDKRRKALTLRYMALVDLKQKKSQDALTALNESLLLLADDRRNEALTREVLAEAYAQTDRQEKALESYQQAFSTFQAIGDRSQEAKTLAGLAQVQEAQGRLNEALRNSGEALNLIEGLRAHAGTQQDRTSYFATQQDIYAFHIELLMRLQKQDPSGGYGAQALQVSEKARARSLLESLADAHVDVRQGVDPALLQREHDLEQTIEGKAQRLSELFGRPAVQQQQATLKKEIADLEAQGQQMKAEIRRTSPAYAAITQPQPLSLQEIQKSLLGPDTVLLEYALGKAHSYLWTVSPSEMKSYELPGRDVIGTMVRQVYQLLTARTAYSPGETQQQRVARIADADHQLPAACAQLSQMVLGPAKKEIAGKRLIIVADGALQQIPFAVLNEPGETQPLVVNHELVSLPSASTLAVLREQDEHRPAASEGIAIFADPVFNKADPRILRTKGKPVAVAAGRSDLARGEEFRILVHLADSGSGQAGPAPVVPRLPFTRQEAQAIAVEATGKENLIALDFNASKARAKNASLGRYRYLHFATHGYLDSENPGLSALVLSLVDHNGKPEDGFLRAQDIYNLKLSADLVVLSACQTGLGKEIRGEGIIGLTRGFMYAGVPRVIVSMWSVNDRATEALMAGFYKKLLKQHMRPSAALRQAQIEMWKSKKWSAPFYWGAFIQQGEWR